MGRCTCPGRGGEPTLRELPFFQRVMELCETYRRPTQRIVHALQTNATLIDDAWARFLAEHHVLVGVSIDGPAPMHDSYRVNKAGRGTHEMVIRGWRRLQNAGVEYNTMPLGCLFSLIFRGFWRVSAVVVCRTCVL